MRLDSSTAAGQALLLTDQHITQFQVDCRRVQIMQYFGERFDKAACKGTCDNCRDSLIRDRIVVGLRDPATIKRLCAVPFLSLQQATQIGAAQKRPRRVTSRPSPAATRTPCPPLQRLVPAAERAPRTADARGAAVSGFSLEVPPLLGAGRDQSPQR